MTQVALSILSVIGALAGVTLGAILTARSQRMAWERQEMVKSVQDRRVAYAAFLAAAKEWRATVMGPEVKIVEASSVSRLPHADGGDARTRALKCRTELTLAAHTPETVRASNVLMQAVARLAEARAVHKVGQVPEPIVQACRDAEGNFVHVARAELGSPHIDLNAIANMPG